MTRRGARATPRSRALKTVMNYDDFFKDEQIVRRAVASYYALVSFLDHNIGQGASGRSTQAGLTPSTRVIYTSDHGDNLGCRGPLGQVGDVRGVGRDPDDPGGRRCRPRRRRRYAGFPDRLLPHRARSGRLPAVSGRSRAAVAFAVGDRRRRAARSRTVLSEYHAVASVTGSFMIRHGRWKYIHHVGYRPELFDLERRSGRNDRSRGAARDGLGSRGVRGRAAAHLRSGRR